MSYINKARWVTDKYILLMLGLFPLFVGFHGYSDITASKFWFFAIATGLWAAAALALLILSVLADERCRLDIRPAHLAIGIFLAMGALSLLASPYGTAGLSGANRRDGYMTTLLYGLIFFGVSWLARPRRRYVWALGISSALCCTIAVLQLFGLDPFWLYPTGTNYYDKFIAYNSAFLGTIGNTGLLAAYLCATVPVTGAFAVLSEHKLDRWLLLPAALGLGILAACDVDAGVLAMAGCVLVSVPMLIRRDRTAKTAACVSGGLVIAGLAVLYFWPGRSGTIYEMSQVLHGHLADEFGSHRGQIWKQAWQLFKERPLLGGGPGTTSLRFDIQWYSEVRNQNVAVTNPHNVYLGYLVNTGILGLLPYLAAIGCSFVTWFKRRKDSGLYPALGAAFVCYLIQDFFGLGLSLTAPVFWVIWGLLETSPAHSGSPRHPAPARSPQRPGR